MDDRDDSSELRLDSSSVRFTIHDVAFEHVAGDKESCSHSTSSRGVLRSRRRLTPSRGAPGLSRFSFPEPPFTSMRGRSSRLLSYVRSVCSSRSLASGPCSAAIPSTSRWAASASRSPTRSSLANQQSTSMARIQFCGCQSAGRGQSLSRSGWECIAFAGPLIGYKDSPLTSMEEYDESLRSVCCSSK